jgi:mono/diheme cytochrome c family protein
VIRKFAYLFAAAAALVAGCGGGGGASEEPRGREPASEPAVAALPVAAPTGEIDETLADAGEELFSAKGCVACHTIGKGRLTGPDLAGVTERRSFEWTYHQIMRPDSMTLHDPTARQLMAEYMTQMPDLDLRPEEARALYEYMRHEDHELAEDAEGGNE